MKDGRSLSALLVLAALGLAGLVVWQARTEIEETTAFQRALAGQRLRGELGQLDDILTLSTRLAVATGDLAWEVRHGNAARALATALDGAHVALPADGARDREAFREVVTARLALEQRILDLVRAGRREEARLLLASPAYGASRAAGADGLRRLTRTLEAAAARAHAVHEGARVNSLAATLGAVLVVAGILVLTRLLVGREAALASTCRRLELEGRARADAETRLRESETRLALATQGSSDAFLDLDVPTNRLWSSDRMHEMLGYAPGDIAFSRAEWEARLHPEDRERARSALAAHLERDVPLDLEHRLRRRGGDYRWFRVRARTLRRADGTALRVSGSFQDVTDQRRAEAELREARDFLRATLDALEAHVAILDARGLILQTNRAWDRFAEENGARPAATGPGSDYLGACTRAVGPGADDGRRIAEAIGTVTAGRAQAVTLEYACHVPGRERWFEATVSRFGEDPTRVVVTHVDVTARKLAERAAVARADELEKLALVAAHMERGVVIGDGGGTVEWVNDAFTRLSGYTLDEAGGHPMERYLEGPATASEAGAPIREAVRRGAGLRIEAACRRKDGQAYWAEIDVRPIGGTAGRPTRIIAIVGDVTERRRYQDALHAEHTLLRSMAANVPFHVFWKGRDSRFLGCNEVFARAMGFASPQALVGKTDYDLAVDPAEADWYRECDERAMASGTPLLNIEETMRRPDGSVAVLLTSKVPLRDRAGRVTGLLGIFTDITEHKRMAAQLAQAQKLEAIGQLAAGIAHEINTPTEYVSDNREFLETAFGRLLRLVEGVLEVVERGGSTDGRALAAELAGRCQAADLDYLRTEIPLALAESREGLERIASIVAAMKDFSHPSGGEIRQADLNAAIRSTATVCRNRWKRVARLELDLDTTLPAVPCVRDQLNQVVLNLIVNAADAIAAKGGDAPGELGTIRITTRQTEGWVEICVADTGTGIPAALQARVFDPFFTTKEVGKGTGQGLAIAHDVVVKRHGGTITLESREGEGTTFAVRLPLAAVAERDDEDDAPAATHAALG